MVENLTKIILIGVGILFTVILIRISYYHINAVTDVMKQDTAIATARAREEELSDLYDMTTHKLIGMEVVNAIRRYDEAGYGIYMTASGSGDTAVTINGQTVYKVRAPTVSIETADNDRSFYVNPSAYYTCYVGRVNNDEFAMEADYSFVSDIAFVQEPTNQYLITSPTGQWWETLSEDSKSALYDAFEGSSVESRLADYRAAVDKVGKMHNNPDYFVETYELSVSGGDSSNQSTVTLKDVPAYIIAYDGVSAVYHCASYAEYMAAINGTLSVTETNEVYKLELASGTTKIIIIY